MKKRLYLLFIFCFSTYTLFQSGHIYSVDGAGRYKLTQAIANGKLYIDEPLFNFHERDGKYYCAWLIGQSIFELPLYYIGKVFAEITKEPDIEEFFVSFINCIFASFIILIIYTFAIHLGYKHKLCLFLSLAYGFSTFAAIYARDTLDIVQESFFLLASVFLIYMYIKTLSKKFLILSGLSYGFACITRYTPLIIAPVFLIFLLPKRTPHLSLASGKDKWKDVLIFALLTLPFLGWVCFYNKIAFGSIFTTGYKVFWGNYKVMFFGRNPLLVFALYLFSPKAGIIFFAPIIILFFIYIKSFYKTDKKIAIVFIYIIVSYIVFHSFLINPDTWFGPRYLLPILPYFILPIGKIRINKCRRCHLKFLYSLFVVGLLVQLPSLLVNHQRYTYWATVNKEEGNMFNPKYSIISGQYQMLFEVTQKMRTGDSWKLATYNDGFSPEQMLNESRTMNIYDLWYVQMYYLGYPKILLIFIFSLFFLTSIFSGILIFKKVDDG